MISVHLTFAGRCEEAFRFYERTLGGTRLFLMRWRDSPAAGDVPADFGDKVVHATLTLGDAQLAGADVPAAGYQRPCGFYVLFSAATRADAERIFAAFADGGEVQMPLAQTFWSPAFGVVVDRYGTPWEITVTAA